MSISAPWAAGAKKVANRTHTNSSTPSICNTPPGTSAQGRTLAWPATRRAAPATSSHRQRWRAGAQAMGLRSKAGTSRRPMPTINTSTKPEAWACLMALERLWPRGVSKERAGLHLWLKEVAPSPELRKWYNHDPEHWPEFRSRYLAELQGKRELVAQLLDLLRQGNLTLLHAARTERNSASVVEGLLTALQA